MTAYVIVMREEPVQDETAMAEYQKLTRSSPPNPNLKPLVIYGQVEALEGSAPDGVVVLEFPSMAEAKEWYDSPEYQQAVVHRLRSAAYRSFIVEGM